MKTLDPSIDAAPSLYEIEQRISRYRTRVLVACIRRDWNASIFDSSLDPGTTCVYPGCGRPLRRGGGALCVGHVKQLERAAQRREPRALKPIGWSAAPTTCKTCGRERRRYSDGAYRCTPCETKKRREREAEKRGANGRKRSTPDTSAPPCARCGAWRTREGAHGWLRCRACLKRSLSSKRST